MEPDALNPNGIRGDKARRMFLEIYATPRRQIELGLVEELRFAFIRAERAAWLRG